MLTETNESLAKLLAAFATELRDGKEIEAVIEDLGECVDELRDELLDEED